MMKNFLRLTFLSFLFFTLNDVSTADAISQITQSETFQNEYFSYTSANIDLNFSLIGGYRVDQLDWSIAGHLGNDYWNILSELMWKNIEIFQIQLSNRTLINDSIYFRASIKKGLVFNGSNKDTDYNGNDRINAWSQSQNTSDDGSVMDLSLGVGYALKNLLPKIQFVPLIGFSHNKQCLLITEGYQTISAPVLDKHIFPVPLGPFPGLNSSYKTDWRGPWLGLDIGYSWTNSCLLTFSMEHHWVDYDAEGNWNLIDRFNHPKSFEHNAVGHGKVLRANYCSLFKKDWYYIVDVEYQHWQTKSGVDRTFFSNGSIVDTRLNRVNRESFSVLFGLSYHF